MSLTVAGEAVTGGARYVDMELENVRGFGSGSSAQERKTITYPLGGLDESTEYEVWVQVITAEGASPESERAHAYTLEDGAYISYELQHLRLPALICGCTRKAAGEFEQIRVRMLHCTLRLLSAYSRAHSAERAAERSQVRAVGGRQLPARQVQTAGALRALADDLQLSRLLPRARAAQRGARAARFVACQQHQHGCRLQHWQRRGQRGCEAVARLRRPERGRFPLAQY